MKIKPISAFILASSLALMGGCATGTSDQAAVNSGVSAEEFEAYKLELANKQAEINRLKDAANSSQGMLANTGDSDLFPPNPEAGHCYARVLIPANYVTESESVLQREASFRYNVIPAVHEPAQESVLVREASTRLDVIPATYKEITEQVLVRPASTKLMQVPAEYETVSEQVLDKPAHTIWKRGAGPVDGALQTAVDQSTGEVVCLVEVPASYRTVTKTVLKSPASTREIDIPAEYRTITKTVIDTPATTREVTIPAEYQTVKTTRLVSPATTQKIDIPAEYVTVTKRNKVSDEELEWREVLCKDNMTPEVIRTMQAGLDQAGYLRGSVDGIFGPGTLKATNAYAESKNLPVGKSYIAIETASSLGVDI